ncbi:MAG TPA: short-chain dehydrogenase [Flavobacteriaceae bacterium]|nr:short-chain dehydrogenase [Flavobacteriaceae bacterium]
MELNLTGKTALVCGSTAGIGKATALELAQLGAQIVLLARNPEKLEQTLRELPRDFDEKHDSMAVDFSDTAGFETAIAALAQKHQFHILINNTGGPAAGPAFEADPAQYAAAFAQHLLCNQILVQAVVPGMKKAHFGRIVNVISTSVKQPIENLGVSNTIRGAVANWSKTLSVELGPFGITVNNVLPGFTATDRLEDIVNSAAKRMNKTPQQARDFMTSVVPARRFAEAQEIAYGIAFLCSPSAGYINGINLPIDGGRTKSL